MVYCDYHCPFMLFQKRKNIFTTILVLIYYAKRSCMEIADFYLRFFILICFFDAMLLSFYQFGSKCTFFLYYEKCRFYISYFFIKIPIFYAFHSPLPTFLCLFDFKIFFISKSIKSKIFVSIEQIPLF